MKLSHADTARRVAAKLHATRPDGEKWSTDFHPRGRDYIENYLTLAGRTGEFGERFEDISDPYAVHIPGCTERTVQSLLESVEETGITVTAEARPGKTPRYGLGGRHSTAGLMDVRGVVLALLVEYSEKGAQVPPELVYAASRISTSGTHTGGVTHAFASALKNAVRP